MLDRIGRAEGRRDEYCRTLGLKAKCSAETAARRLSIHRRTLNRRLSSERTGFKAIADEIGKLSGSTVVDPKTIQAKQEEGEKLQRDMKYEKEQADADFAKRYEQEMTTISKDIRDALNQFAAQRGITMLLDISKFGDAILIAAPGMDITQAFISEFNSRPATASAGTR